MSINPVVSNLSQLLVGTPAPGHVPVLGSDGWESRLLTVADVVGAAASAHTHDDRYYDKLTVNDLLADLYASIPQPNLEPYALKAGTAFTGAVDFGTNSRFDADGNLQMQPGQPFAIKRASDGFPLLDFSAAASGIVDAYILRVNPFVRAGSYRSSNGPTFLLNDQTEPVVIGSDALPSGVTGPVVAVAQPLYLTSRLETGANPIFLSNYGDTNHQLGRSVGGFGSDRVDGPMLRGNTGVDFGTGAGVHFTVTPAANYSRVPLVATVGATFGGPLVAPADTHFKILYPGVGAGQPAIDVSPTGPVAIGYPGATVTLVGPLVANAGATITGNVLLPGGSLDIPYGNFSTGGSAAVTADFAAHNGDFHVSAPYGVVEMGYRKHMWSDASYSQSRDGTIGWTNDATSAQNTLSLRLRQTSPGTLTLDDGAGGAARLDIAGPSSFGIRLGFGAANSGFTCRDSGAFGVTLVGARTYDFAPNNFRLRDSVALEWSSDPGIEPGNLRLRRTAANTLTLDDGAGGGATLAFGGTDVNLRSGAVLDGNYNFKDADGNVRAAINLAGGFVYSQSGFGMYNDSSGFNNTGLDLIPSQGVSWRNGSFGTTDTRLRRTAANTLALDDGAGGAADLNVLGKLGVGTPANPNFGILSDNTSYPFVARQGGANRFYIHESGDMFLHRNAQIDGHVSVAGTTSSGIFLSGDFRSNAGQALQLASNYGVGGNGITMPVDNLTVGGSAVIRSQSGNAYFGHADRYYAIEIGSSSSPYTKFFDPVLFGSAFAPVRARVTADKTLTLDDGESGAALLNVTGGATFGGKATVQTLSGFAYFGNADAPYSIGVGPAGAPGVYLDGHVTASAGASFGGTVVMNVPATAPTTLMAGQFQPSRDDTAHTLRLSWVEGDGTLRVATINHD